MDNLESAMENTKVSKAHLCYRTEQVYERKNIKGNAHLGIKAQLSHQP